MGTLITIIAGLILTWIFIKTLKWFFNISIFTINLLASITAITILTQLVVSTLLYSLLKVYILSTQNFTLYILASTALGALLFLAAKNSSSKAWFFSLCSVVIFTIIFSIQISIINIIYPLFNEKFKTFIPEEIFASIIILCIGILILNLIYTYKDHNNTFRYFGRIIVTLNTLLISITTYFIYQSYVQAFSNQGQIIFGMNYYSSGILSFFLATIYFQFINLSAFFSYGYDNFIAWLISKNSPPTHWMQKSFSSLRERFSNAIKTMDQRIPETILHWHSTFGGTVGAYIGHRFFRHKMFKPESKAKFAPIFNGTVIIQIILVISLVFLETLIPSINSQPAILATTKCSDKSQEFVVGETDTFNIYICGLNRPFQYIGVDKNTKSSIYLNLTKSSNVQYVAKNGTFSYTVTRNNLKISQNGRIVQTQILRVSKWRDF
jgi:uncharacterized membrane protein YsdA (DUF1294 family)